MALTLLRQMLLIGSVLAVVVPPAFESQQHPITSSDVQASFKCDLPPVVSPGDDGLPSAANLFSGEEALLKQVERHSALVKVPTICYDNLGRFDEDDRWEPFYDFHRVLEETFPILHAHATREKINRFGLLYTLPGSSPSLKSIMLTAHQDVVPVADAKTWTHPPFSAYFDGTWLWGRGSSDDKNSLTAVLSALETLLANDWRPRRTVLVALGFDEECSGVKGAGSIARHLTATKGNDSVALVLDEGGMGLQALQGEKGDGDALYALPAVMEKGHVDVWMELHVQGGHSSVPFPHTGIGIISEIVAALEAHPYKPLLAAGSPVHNHLVCQARYSPKAQPSITRLVRKGNLKALAEELATLDRPTQFRIQTSQSVDIMTAGQKINAMPEVVTLGVNYRVAPHDSIPEVKKNVLKYIRPTAKKFNLTIVPFGEEESYVDFLRELDLVSESGETSGDVKPLYDVDYNGTLVLRTTQETLVAPVSPTSGPVWDLFSGTIQHSFAFDGGKVVPVGELMTGNTDTRHYLGLTRNVYRWTPTRQGGNFGVHTIDERINMHVHMEALRFYYDLIRNFDASDV